VAWSDRYNPSVGLERVGSSFVYFWPGGSVLIGSPHGGKIFVRTSCCRWIVGNRCPLHMVRLNVRRGVRLGLFRCVFVVAHRQILFCYATYDSTVILLLIVGSRCQNRPRFFENQDLSQHAPWACRSPRINPPPAAGRRAACRRRRRPTILFQF
jgi:hypothetical protein